LKRRGRRMRLGSTPPEPRTPLPVAHAGLFSTLRGLSPVRERSPQRSRPSGSRRLLAADRELVLPPFVSLQRLPQPATAFPTPGVGGLPQTTPSQGRAGGGQVGCGRARLGLDQRGTLASPHGSQLHSRSPCFLLSRVRLLT
jgi:hypothetical protein